MSLTTDTLILHLLLAVPLLLGILVDQPAGANASSTPSVTDYCCWSKVENWDNGRGTPLAGGRHEAVGGERDGQTYPSLPLDSIIVNAQGNPSTLAPGDTLFFAWSVANLSSTTVRGDAWLVITRGATPVRTGLLFRGELPPGSGVGFSGPIRVPRSTPPDLYTFTVNAGRFPNVVVASDAFDVTVTGGRTAGAPSGEPFEFEAVAGEAFAVASAVSVSPNPVLGQAALRFTLAEASHVRLSIHDALGREVAVLVDGERGAGEHTVVFDGGGLAAGVYLVRLTAGSGFTQIHRMTLLR